MMITLVAQCRGAFSDEEQSCLLLSSIGVSWMRQVFVCSNIVYDVTVFVSILVSVSCVCWPVPQYLFFATHFLGLSQTITDHETFRSFSICNGRGCVSFCPHVPCSGSSFLCILPRSAERLQHWRLDMHSVWLLFLIICHGFKWGLGFPGWTNWFMVDADNHICGVVWHCAIEYPDCCRKLLLPNSETAFWHGRYRFITELENINDFLSISFFSGIAFKYFFRTAISGKYDCLEEISPSRRMLSDKDTREYTEWNI